MPAGAEAYAKPGIASHLGRRDAYAALVKQQRKKHGQCNITLFTLLTYYNLSIAKRKSKKNGPALMQLKQDGTITDPPNRFQLGMVVFIYRKDARVVNTVPFIPINWVDERSCYSILLLHHPWPTGGECALVNEEDITAVATLNRLRRDNLLLPYVIPMITRIETSEEIQRDQGVPVPTATNDYEQDGDDPDIEIDLGTGQDEENNTDVIDSHDPPAISDIAHLVTNTTDVHNKVHTRVSAQKHTRWTNFITAALHTDETAFIRENQISMADEARMVRGPPRSRNV